MEKFNDYNEFDSSILISIEKPTIELLQDAQFVSETWPEIVARDPNFINQINEHTILVDSLLSILNIENLPKDSLEKALNQNLLSEELVVGFYNNISKLIDDPDYERLILYLPFELIPDNTWTPNNTELRQAIDNFRTSFLKSWNNLLLVHDVKANFIDGDIEEAESNVTENPRVVKAAELVPILIENGILTTEQVNKIISESNDEILKEDLSKSLDNFGEKSDKLPPHVPSLKSLKIQFDVYNNSIKDINENTTSDHKKKWLVNKQTNDMIESLGKQVSLLLGQNKYDYSMVFETLIVKDINLACQIMVEGIYQLINNTSNNNENINNIYQQYKPNLEKFLNLNSDDIKDRANLTYIKLYKLGIIEKSFLDNHNIIVPTLDGPLSDNLEYMSDDLDRLKDIVFTIENNEELSELFYPVLTVGGSRLKGYGNKDSDLDISIFVKPGTSLNRKNEIKNKLNILFCNDETIEIWLEENNDQLTIKNPEEFDIHQADNLCTHTIFGTAWIGSDSSIINLRKNLQSIYFEQSNDQENEINIRRLYLERLEQDLLQYRLMHKGYSKYYPLLKQNNLINIDSKENTIFWDSGYRLLATKIFLKMIFLPKIYK